MITRAETRPCPCRRRILPPLLRWAGLAALVLMSGACTERHEGPQLPGAHEVPGPGGTPAPWVLLGEVGGTHPVGEITDFDVNDRGDVAFLDAMNHRVTLVQATGETIVLGGRGRGPGELTLPRAVALMNDGSVAVVDVAAGRITLWGPQGEIVGTTGVPPLRVNSLATDGVRLATLVDVGTGLALPDSAGVPVRVLRFDGLTPLPSVLLDAGERPDGGHGASSLSAFAMLDDNRFILVRYRGGYNLTLGSLDGGEPQLIRREVTRQPGSVDAYRRVRTRNNESLVGIARAVGLERERIGRVLWPGELPDSIPAMPSLAELGPFGEDAWGRIWVARGMPGPEGSLFDVFDPEGGFLGEVPLPGPTLSGIRVRGTYAVGIHFGPFDVPSLFLFRVPAETPPG